MIKRDAPIKVGEYMAYQHKLICQSTRRTNMSRLRTTFLYPMQAFSRLTVRRRCELGWCPVFLLTK